MIRVGGALVILQVAGHTGGCRQVVVAVYVALRAGQRLMCSGERESDRAVVEGRGLPRGCVVARLAGLREGQRDVIGICTFLIIGQMAAYAVCRSPLKSSSGVASATVERGVGTDQGKTRHLQVVELGSQPVVHPMALLAPGWKTAADVAGFGALKVFRVTGIALRRESHELPHGRARVARATIQGCMCAQQGKAILMLVDLLHRNLPSLYGVALVAGCSKLPLVNIGMTIGAFLAYVCEDRLGVALSTTDPLVHSA
jgi:hypothetical protein